MHSIRLVPSCVFSACCYCLSWGNGDRCRLPPLHLHHTLTGIIITYSHGGSHGLFPSKSSYKTSALLLRLLLLFRQSRGDAPELEISCSKCVRRAHLANLCVNAFRAAPNSTNTNGQTWRWSPRVWRGQHETRGRHIYRRVSIFHVLGWSLMMSPTTQSNPQMLLFVILIMQVAIKNII